MIELTADNFDANIAQNNGLSIIDFWAPWCGPCKMFTPIFEETSKGFKDVQFAKCNVDDNGEVAQKFGVRSIPTVVFVKGGQEVDRVTGALSQEEFTKRVQQNMQ